MARHDDKSDNEQTVTSRSKTSKNRKGSISSSTEDRKASSHGRSKKDDEVTTRTTKKSSSKRRDDSDDSTTHHRKSHRSDKKHHRKKSISSSSSSESESSDSRDRRKSSKKHNRTRDRSTDRKSRRDDNKKEKEEIYNDRREDSKKSKQKDNNDSEYNERKTRDNNNNINNNNNNYSDRRDDWNNNDNKKNGADAEKRNDNRQDNNGYDRREGNDWGKRNQNNDWNNDKRSGGYNDRSYNRDSGNGGRPDNTNDWNNGNRRQGGYNERDSGGKPDAGGWGNNGRRNDNQDWNSGGRTGDNNDWNQGGRRNGGFNDRDSGNKPERDSWGNNSRRNDNDWNNGGRRGGDNNESGNGGRYNDRNGGRAEGGGWGDNKRTDGDSWGNNGGRRGGGYNDRGGGGRADGDSWGNNGGRRGGGGFDDRNDGGDRWGNNNGAQSERPRLQRNPLEFLNSMRNIKEIDWTAEQSTLTEYNKNFYQPSEIVAKMTKEQADVVRTQFHIKIVSCPPGVEVPNPILEFADSGFPESIVAYLSDKFSTPSPIQMQAWPVALSGLDMLGIAETGSGKTLGFLIPALIHISHQPERQPGDGPVVLVLAPTRELSRQIQSECRNLHALGKGVKSVAIYGGGFTRDQTAALQGGCDIVVASPGKLIYFVQNGVLSLKRVTYLVLDEADKMLEENHLLSIRKIARLVRPDRQALMWSATWPPAVRELARCIFKQQPFHINIGDITAHSVDKITHEFVKIGDENDLWKKFKEIVEANPDLRILVFTETKKECNMIERDLNSEVPSCKCKATHGDKDQIERNFIIEEFTSGRTNVVVTTALLERGIDMKKVGIVVNFRLPQNLEAYIHRTGRTGRAGAEGRAITFVPAYGYDNLLMNGIANAIMSAKSPYQGLEEFVDMSRYENGNVETSTETILHEYRPDEEYGMNLAEGDDALYEQEKSRLATKGFGVTPPPGFEDAVPSSTPNDGDWGESNNTDKKAEDDGWGNSNSNNKETDEWGNSSSTNDETKNNNTPAAVDDDPDNPYSGWGIKSPEKKVVEEKKEEEPMRGGWGDSPVDNSGWGSSNGGGW